MINNFQQYKSRTQLMLELLDNFREQEFFLTGSRFFGGAKENSDYDFFTANTEWVCQFLTLNGFTLVEAYKSDVNLIVTYRLLPCYSEQLYDDHAGYFDDVTSPVVHGAEGFDIQIVKDLELKHKAQEVLKGLYPDGLPFDKESNKHLWSVAYAALNHNR